MYVPRLKSVRERLSREKKRKRSATSNPVTIKKKKKKPVDIHTM